jgi:hypothetical protein
MPAWGGAEAHSAEDNWKLVHFIRHLPEIQATELEEMKQFNPKSKHEAEGHELARHEGEEGHKQEQKQPHKH